MTTQRVAARRAAYPGPHRDALARAARHGVRACCAALAVAGGAAHAADARVDKRVAADPAGTVVVSNVAGRLTIEGWERPEVHVSGTVGEAVQRVDVTKDGSRTVVKVVLPRGASMRGGEADLLVQVPAAAALEVSAVSSGVATRRVGGPQRVNAVSGEVSIDAAGGSVEVKSVSGRVVLRGRGQAGTVRLATVSGDVRAEGVGGEVEATSVSGDLVLALGTLRAARLRSTSGDIELRGAPERGARLEAESVSGDLVLALRAPGGFEIDAESFNGDISTCYGARGTSGGGFGPGKALRGTRGAGEARLRLKSMSGDIEVCDR